MTCEGWGMTEIVAMHSVLGSPTGFPAIPAFYRVAFRFFAVRMRPLTRQRWMARIGGSCPKSRPRKLLLFNQPG